MKYLILLLLPVLSFAQSYEDYYDYLRYEEGLEWNVYIDSTGNYSIGIGHKILPDENYDGYTLDKSEIHALFKKDLEIAIDGTKRLIRNFDKQSADVKIALVSMCYNLGETGFSKFIKFRKAIELFQYDEAIRQITNSKWARQVPNRAKRVIKILNEN